ncbi:MAG: hypothetical protein LBS85_08240, partial [Clostridiales Family XIII bacterium]|nr:hypothetical protein [Clostridiales Family XIII bacterium]
MRDYYEILENDLLCGGPSPIYRLTVAAEDIASEAEPGRFVNIYPPGGDLLLPRPIGIADVNGERVT